MNRRQFLGALHSAGLLLATASARAARRTEIRADLVIAGGGLGGCAAALAALRNGLRVVLVEETDWIGGQLTSQGVPPDEHRWIETHGATRTYRALREGIRDYYRRHYPLTEAARALPHLNPGDGAVSRLCHEPRVALAVLEGLLAPYLSNRSLTLLLEQRITTSDVEGESVRSLRTDRGTVLSAPWFIDATELGDLLPLTRTEFVTGAESRRDTGEEHAAEKADPENQQAFTMCFAVDYRPGENHVIERPREYAFWRDYVPKLRPPWPGKLLSLTYTHPPTGKPRTLGFNPEGETPGAYNLWRYRRIISKDNFAAGTYAGDTSLINWPQNDYLLGNLVGVSEREKARHIERATQLSLSLLYWLQTEVPRPDGKQGWPGLRLRGDLLGSATGVAKYPYVREARRIRAQFTVVEQEVGQRFFDSIGVGSYAIDLHPTTTGDNYIDFQTKPFEVPLGALLPVRTKNLIPACKNIGTTHVTNGCYRLHPVEWNIGESAGLLIAFGIKQKIEPAAIRSDPGQMVNFQEFIHGEGVEIHWPEGEKLK